MFIEQVVLDGFKSYWKRTVVSGFDPTFNAITGLNGSGKSNILDAICFVLGISNLAQVRVRNLSELVYKQGQTGVTRAIVEITFNNEDKEQSPLGYAEYDRITVKREVNIGGRNKYYINGHPKALKVVQNFFHSVQLNVNNPHFLIMQGRITKVLNMKPLEILAMIEEAAGTRMFERNKRDAERTLEKKDTKVAEIDRILSDDITPTLEFLSREKAKMILFTSNNAECERLTRFCVAFDYSNAVTESKASEGRMKALEDATVEHTATAEGAEDAVAELEKELEQLRGQRDTDFADGCKELQAAKAEAGRRLAVAKTGLKHKTSELADAKKTVKTLHRQLESLSSSSVTHTERLERQRTVLLERKDTVALVQRQLSEMQARKTTVAAGMTEDEDGGTTTVGEQLLQAQRDLRSYSSEMRSCELRMDGLEATIKRVQKELKAAKKDQAVHDTKLDKAKAAHDKAQKVLNGCKYSSEREDFLRKRQAELQEQVSDLSAEQDRLETELRGLQFRHRARGLSADAVRGRVAKLFDIRDPDHTAALEAVAGGKLRNVVVDTVDTCTVLLNSRLEQRTTFIPLDAMRKRGDANRLREDIVKRVKEENDGVCSCMDLLECDPDVEPALELVFGKTMWCPSDEAAKQVTFGGSDPRCRCHTVINDGTLFNPRGVMEGGAPPKHDTLGKLRRLKDVQEQLKTATAELKDVERELASLEKLAVEYEQLQAAADMTAQTVALLQGQRDDSSYSRLERQLTEAESKLEAETQGREAAATNADKAAERIARLEEEKKNVESARAAKLQEVEEGILTLTQESTVAEEAIMKLSQEEVEIETQLQQCQAEYAAQEEEIIKSEAAVEALEKEVEALKQGVDDAKTEFDAAEAAEASRRRLIDECKSRIREKEEAKRDAVKAKTTAEKKLKELERSKADLRRATDAAKAMMEELATSHPWIESEQELFGRPGTDYDFARRDPAEAAEALRKLEAEQAALSKKVNKKAMSLMETAEKEYEDVMNKKRIIANDKKKIQEVIAELDQKKNDALRKTWEKVNRDFGSIFSTLLPGTSAKLEPPAGGTVLDGLEVRVAFNGVWKESLTELSGGQRSLLALSLILSLLLFKPAPMYILDEVDAALDLSHTQNIGHMLKTHFAQSQFIVVSLKQGMFNNANVVFRTCFENGESKVKRTLPTSAGTK